MGRRKKQHPRLAFGAIPRWLYDMLANGEISGPQFVVWAVIRGYVKDEERGTFSPPPIDLTNREIAQGAGISTKRARQLLAELEEVGVLQRLTADELADRGLGGNRWLRLIRPHTPLKNKGEINMGEKDMEETNKNSSRSSPADNSQASPSADALVLVARSGEGGAGGEGHTPLRNRGEIHNPHKNKGEKNKVEKSQGEKRRAVALTLRDLGAFSGVDYEIADTMLAAERFNTLEGTDLRAEVRDIFYRVYHQSEQDARNAHEAMRFTISRLRNGDWGDRVAKTRDEARSRRLDQYPQTTSFSPKQPPPSEAQQLWQEALGIMELQMTRATFDTRLRESAALEINGNGQTLVVQVRNRYDLEWLESKLYPVVLRALRQVLQTRADDERLGLNLETLDVHFVIPEPDTKPDQA
jgi:hypothetical protein